MCFSNAIKTTYVQKIRKMYSKISKKYYHLPLSIETPRLPPHIFIKNYFQCLHLLKPFIKQTIILLVSKVAIKPFKGIHFNT